MERIFKSGDRVKLKVGGPVMEVLKYEMQDHPLLGSMESNSKVRCVWHDEFAGRMEGVFHQNSLCRIWSPNQPPVKQTDLKVKTKGGVK